MSQQNPDGGFGWVEGAESDTDDTGVAIQALVVLGEDPQNSEVISKALDFIKSYQSADGGFSAGEWMGKESNTASDAWVLQGLFAAKENPLARKWQSGNKTVIDSLISNQTKNGSFNWKDGKASSTTQMTAYALMALTQKSHPVNINPATSISKTSPFVDLDVSYWAYYDIINLVNSGVISGYPDKTFKPEKK